MQTIKPTALQIAATRLMYQAAHLSRRLKAMRHTAFIEVGGRRV